MCSMVSTSSNSSGWSFSLGNNKLFALRMLTSCSWECDINVPDILIEVLHRCFKDVRIGISAKSLDQAILSSPRLQRLSVSVAHTDPTSQGSHARWRQLKHVLLNCQSLRALTINAHLDSLGRTEPIVSRNEVTPGSKTSLWWHANATPSSHDSKPLHEESTEKTQLPLEAGDSLPSLEELDIRSNTYDLDVVHCALLLDCMDWSKLKRLSLGPSNPKSYFDVFRGQLPQLEALDFAYHFEYLSFNDHYTSTLTACSAFVTSLPHLVELTIRCDGINFKDMFWSALVETHGDTLKSLSIQGHTPTSEAPFVKGEMNMFLACFEKLINLDLVLQTPFPRSNVCSFCSVRSHGVVSIILAILN